MDGLDRAITRELQRNTPRVREPAMHMNPIANAVA
jgi:hypothetical protein